MIISTFSLGEQILEVTIGGNGLKLRDVGENALVMPNFTYLKVIAEFPDLKDDVQWKEKAAQRFVEYFNNIEGEMKKLEYIRGELVKQGYKPIYWQTKGFRIQRFKEAA